MNKIIIICGILLSKSVLELKIEKLVIFAFFHTFEVKFIEIEKYETKCEHIGILFSM